MTPFNNRFGNWVLRAEEDPKKGDESGSGRKVPSGFEKLLKRSKRGSSEASSKGSENETES